MVSFGDWETISSDDINATETGGMDQRSGGLLPVKAMNCLHRIQYNLHLAVSKWLQVSSTSLSYRPHPPPFLLLFLVVAL